MRRPRPEGGGWAGMPGLLGLLDSQAPCPHQEGLVVRCRYLLARR